jgi:hypothetical protein
MAVAIATAPAPVERGEPAHFILTDHPDAYPHGIVAISIDHPACKALPHDRTRLPTASVGASPVARLFVHAPSCARSPRLVIRRGGEAVRGHSLVAVRVADFRAWSSRSDRRCAPHQTHPRQLDQLAERGLDRR